MATKEIFSANLYLEDNEAKLADKAMKILNQRKHLDLTQRTFLRYCFLKHCEMLIHEEEEL
jgi:hypothetical protein